MIENVEKLEIAIKHQHGKIHNIGYADEILILSHKKAGLQKQLKEIEELRRKAEIKFSPLKN